MKKIVVFIFFLISLTTFSQKTDFWDNVKFGGGFTLGFGYLYSEINDFSTTAYSTSILSLYQTKFNVQFSGEFEYYFAKQQVQGFDSFNSNFPALHLGVAYNQGRFAVGIRYDVLYDDDKSVFASPISPVVRFYF